MRASANVTRDMKVDAGVYNDALLVTFDDNLALHFRLDGDWTHAQVLDYWAEVQRKVDVALSQRTVSA
jgi:hypothetical protein